MEQQSGLKLVRVYLGTLCMFGVCCDIRRCVLCALLELTTKKKNFSKIQNRLYNSECLCFSLQKKNIFFLSDKTCPEPEVGS